MCAEWSRKTGENGRKRVKMAGEKTRYCGKSGPDTGELVSGGEIEYERLGNEKMRTIARICLFQFSVGSNAEWGWLWW